MWSDFGNEVTSDAWAVVVWVPVACEMAMRYPGPCTLVSWAAVFGLLNLGVGVGLKRRIFSFMANGPRPGSMYAPQPGPTTILAPSSWVNDTRSLTAVVLLPPVFLVIRLILYFLPFTVNGWALICFTAMATPLAAGMPGAAQLPVSVVSSPIVTVLTDAAPAWPTPMTAAPEPAIERPRRAAAALRSRRPPLDRPPLDRRDPPGRSGTASPDPPPPRDALRNVIDTKAPPSV